ncbi:hypothetical protein PV325_013964 [Microctonus aethiopoides]|nr:hypothetical protein PV325_013964 [Microctonus aethiopoides]
MYFYASKLTAAALSAGLRGGGGGNVNGAKGGPGANTSGNTAVCRCHETDNSNNIITTEPRSPSPPLQLADFPPPPSSTQRGAQQLHPRSSRVSLAPSPSTLGPTTSEHVFVTANIEHPRSNQHHRHRTKLKIPIWPGRLAELYQPTQT